MLVRLALFLAVVAGSGLWAPDRAAAGLLEYDPQTGVLTYSHLVRDGDRGHFITVEQASAAEYRITDEGTTLVWLEDEPCRYERDFHGVLCTSNEVSGLDLSLGPGADRVVGGPSLGIFACGGGGADVISGGSGPDTLAGGAGRDNVDGGGSDDSVLVDLSLFGGPCEPGEFVDGERLAGGAGNDELQGADGADVIDGGAGDDRLTGFAGDDRLDGGNGGDTMLGLEGADVLVGAGGDDFMYGGGDDDGLDGGDGVDVMGHTVRYDGNGLQNFASAPAIATESGNDRFDGGGGDDDIAAGPGASLDDLLDPLSVAARPVIDRSLATAELNGADDFVGGPGRDSVSYLNRDRPVRVTLDGIADDGSEGEGDRIDPDVEVVTGGARDDVLVAAPEGGGLLFGDLGDDLLLGGAGADLMIGGGDEGRDRLLGRGGPDELRGGPGDDRLDGGAAEDLLLGGAGEDAVAGGDGVDGVEGGPGSDALDGGAGPDCLAGFVFPALRPGEIPPCRRGDVPTPGVGADGADVLHGGGGRDRLTGGPGADLADYADARRSVEVTLAGVSEGERRAFGVGTGDDAIETDVEGVRGGRGDDTLIGNAADNAIDGGLGDDLLAGGGGSDQLAGRSGRDLLVARDGLADALRCGTRRDLALVDVEDELVSTLSDTCEAVDGAGSTAAPGAPTVRPGRRCALAVRLPGSRRTFRLGLATTLPWASRVDGSACAALVRGARGTRAHRRVVRLAGGAFRLRPRHRGRGLEAVLDGGRAGRCGAHGPRTRRLDVAGPPAGFAVRGRTARAEGPGARWTMTDGCHATRVRVHAGTVRVVDLRSGRRRLIAAKGAR